MESEVEGRCGKSETCQRLDSVHVESEVDVVNQRLDSVYMWSQR